MRLVYILLILMISSIILMADGKKKTLLTVVPNPAVVNDKIHFVFDTTNVIEALVTVYDASGKEYFDYQWDVYSDLPVWDNRRGLKKIGGSFAAILWLKYKNGAYQQVSVPFIIQRSK